MKVRISYMLAFGFLMLTAFGERADAQGTDFCNAAWGHNQGFGPDSGTNQWFPTTDLVPTSPGYTLTEWCSTDFTTALVFQDDGNLVVYNVDNKALWASNTNATWDGGPYEYPGNIFALQKDSNVVIYDVYWNPLWASGTDNHVDSYLEVLDGYWGIWATGPWRNERRYP